MRWRAPDERQGELFGELLPLPPSAKLVRPRRRASKPDDAVPVTEPEDVGALAQRLSRADLDVFVVALADDALLDAMVVGTRELKRRAAREARQSRTGRGSVRSGPLSRAAERIVAEWSTRIDDDED